MDKWWLNPLLDGDDYGKYDFYATPLPEDYAKWQFDKVAWKCYDCKKGSHLLFVQKHFFYTLDGYDCMDYDVCWKCFLKDKIRLARGTIKRKIEKEKKALKLARECRQTDKTKSFKTYYNIAREVLK